MPESRLLRAIAMSIVLAAPFSFVSSTHANTFPGENGALVFQAGHRDSGRAGSMDLYLLQWPGSVVVRLTATYDESEASATISPDGSQIAFVRQNMDTYAVDLFVMNLDGTNVRQLTSDGRFKDGPTFSPDGSRIAFSANTAGSPARHVFSVGVDGTGLTDLTPGLAAYASQPSWSPIGGRIAFDVWVPGTSYRTIRLLDLSTNTITTVVDEPGWNSNSPNFSPDGAAIVFERRPSDVSGADSIRVLDLGTMTFVDRLSGGAGSLNEPAYSPDGEQLVYSTGYHLRTLDLTTNVITQITWSTDDRAAAWAVAPPPPPPPTCEDICIHEMDACYAWGNTSCWCQYFYSQCMADCGVYVPGPRRCPGRPR